LVGIEIPTAEIKRRLVSLGATVSGRKGAFSVVPPSYRPDLNEPEDLIEEVVRLRGLDEIPEVLPPRTKPTPRDSRRTSLTRRTRDVMMGCGLTEINTIAFVAPADNRRFPGLLAAAKPVAVVNSLSADLGEMRKSLVGGLVAALQFNLNREAEAFHAFEKAKVFHRNDASVPSESESLAGISYGDYAMSGIGHKAVKSGFATLKGVLETFFSSLNILERIEFSRADASMVPHLHPGKAATFALEGRLLGQIGELHPEEARRLDLTQPCAIFELDFETLIAYGSPAKPITAPPRFPAIRRDLALVLDRDFPAGTVVRTITQIDSPLLESVRLFDVYEGDQVPAGKKSLALSCLYRAKDRTLTDDEVNRAHADVVQKALALLKAELRQ
jgi:phenylalanyl-tRNA synthetase beta chain